MPETGSTKIPPSPIVGPSGYTGSSPDYLAGFPVKPLFSLSNLFTQLSPIDLELKRINDVLGSAWGAELKQLTQKKDRLEEAQGYLAKVDELSIRRKEYRPLIDEARRKIANGALQMDDTVYKGGVHLLETLMTYEEAEKNMLAIRDKIASHYPKGSPDLFRLDMDGRKEEMLDPSNAFMNNLAPVKSFLIFSKSTDPEKLKIADKVEDGFEYLSDSLDLYPEPVAGASSGQCTTIDIEDVEVATQELNDLYGSPEFKTYLDELEKAEKGEMEANEGFKARTELRTASTALKDFEGLLSGFKSYEDKDLQDLTPDDLKKAKGFIEERLMSYKTFLVEERKRVKKENGWSDLPDEGGRSGPGFDNPAVFEWDKLTADIKKVDGQISSLRKEFGNNVSDSNPERDKLKAEKATLEAEKKKLKENGIGNAGIGLSDESCKMTSMGNMTSDCFRLEQIEEKLKKVEGQLAIEEAPIDPTYKLDGEFPDEETKKQAFAALKKYATGAASIAEDHVHGLFGRLILELKKLPSPETEIHKIDSDLTKIGSSSLPNVDDRMKAYEGILSRLDKVAVVRTVDARIKMYEEYLSEMKASDRVLDGAHFVGRYGPKVLSPIFWFWDPVGPRSNYEVGGLKESKAVLEKYRNLRAMVASTDEGKRSEGIAAFVNLEASAIHSTLQGDYEKAATLNQFTIGIGIVLASAVTAGLAEAAVAALFPSIGEMALGGEILFGVNVGAFTVSSHLYQAAFYGKNLLKELGNMVSLDFAGELILNAAMFKYIGKSLETFEKYFEKGLEVVAERNVAAKLGKTLTKTPGASAESLYKKAVTEEMEALRKSVFVKGAKVAGSFAYEGVRFQQWQLYVNTGRLVLSKDQDPIGNALKMSFSPKSLAHSFLFLLMLKGANLAVTPLLKPVHAKIQNFALGKVHEKNFKIVNKEVMDTLGAVMDCLKDGSGDFGKRLQDHEKALLKMGEVIKAVPIKLRNPDFVAKHADMLNKVQSIKRGLISLDSLNVCGVKKSSDGSFTFKDGQHQQLAAILKSNPLVDPSSVRVYDNGLVEARFLYAKGGVKTVRFVPEGLTSSPPQPKPLPKLMPISSAFPKVQIAF